MQRNSNYEYFKNYWASNSQAQRRNLFFSFLENLSIFARNIIPGLTISACDDRWCWSFCEIIARSNHAKSCKRQFMNYSLRCGGLILARLYSSVSEIHLRGKWQWYDRGGKSITGLNAAINAILCQMKNCQLPKLNGWPSRNEVVALEKQKLFHTWYLSSLTRKIT